MLPVSWDRFWLAEGDAPIHRLMTSVNVIALALSEPLAATQLLRQKHQSARASRWNKEHTLWRLPAHVHPVPYSASLLSIRKSLIAKRIELVNSCLTPDEQTLCASLTAF